MGFTAATHTPKIGWNWGAFVIAHPELQMLQSGLIGASEKVFQCRARSQTNVECDLLHLHSNTTVQSAGLVLRAQAPNGHQQNGTDRQGHQDANKTEQLAKSHQRKNHMQGVQANSLAN